MVALPADGDFTWSANQRRKINLDVYITLQPKSHRLDLNKATPLLPAGTLVNIGYTPDEKFLAIKKDANGLYKVGASTNNKNYISCSSLVDELKLDVSMRYLLVSSNDDLYIFKEECPTAPRKMTKGGKGGVNNAKKANGNRIQPTS